MGEKVGSDEATLATLQKFSAPPISPHGIILTALVIENEDGVCAMTNKDANTFKGSAIASGTGYIYVPDALVESYQSATGWSSFKAQIKPLSELPA